MIAIESEVADFLEHFGVKGQKWGVRKKEPSLESVSSKEVKPEWSNKKKTAVILGSAAAVAAIAVGSVYAKKHFGVSFKDIPKPALTTTNFVKSMAEEPVGIVHSSRGLNRGYGFLRDGGLKSVSETFIEQGTHNFNNGDMKRFGKNNASIVARFVDPLGRKDFAGRPIGHDVILPPSMTKGVNNIDDVTRVAWPHIKDLFEPFYRSEAGAFGPGF